MIVGCCFEINFPFNHWSEISKSHGIVVHVIGSAHTEIAAPEILLPLAIAFSLFTVH